MNKWPRFALNALGLALSLTGSAYAQLAAVDPGPYTFATGKFPMWYQDSNQLSMELCQSRAASSRVAASTPPAYMCTLLPDYREKFARTADELDDLAGQLERRSRFQLAG
jgi:hypothetical protein